MADPIERAQGVEPPQGDPARSNQSSQPASHLALATLNELLLGRIPDPAVGMLQIVNQVRWSGTAQPRPCTGRGFGGKDPVDPSMLLSMTEIGPQLILSVFWKPLRVLDHVAVHIDHPERSIGSCSDHDRTEPAVLRGDKVYLALRRISPGCEGGAFPEDNIVLHDIVKGFAGKGVALAAAGEEELVAIDHAGACGGEAAGLLEGVKAFLRRLGGVNTRV